MRWIDLLHRWAGGVVGLVLATLGLSGAILVFKHQWLGWLPGAGDAQRQDVAALAAQMDAALTASGAAPRSVLFPYADFGLARRSYAEGAGAYADQSGQVVAQWTSKWDRVELWLFDLHHHLFLDDLGATAAGIAGLIGLIFVITGVILWWRLRKTFKFRLLPKRMSRPAIVTHHRDIGVVFAPLLFLSMATGMLMVLKPVSTAVFAPGQNVGALQAPFAPPDVEGGALAVDLDWTAMFTAARTRYPGAEIRIVALPRKPGDLIQMRLRQPAEWLPNGRTLVWFRPENGAMIDTRDAQAMPTGIRAYNAVYPLHAAKVGGWLWKLAVASTGLVLAMLGSLAVWTFWFKRPRPRTRPARPLAIT
ncbi:PepSY domain-containing protein [Sphingomonas suaedae]|uniref:PepSY domain-containing protein n=1 Tax=Sphingomonas suaedae TaxID=2599297 RepID=A0A518REF5_9SPHN|nr:PepSY-associated TM helix domain-containing protein [Sphingomonas suaedae]QDX25813.1 PepSY domain-containing protein [Sphingomonas suaedae]